MESEDLVEGFRGVFSNHPEWQEAMWVTKSEERFIQFDPGFTNLSATLRKIVNEDLKYQIRKASVADHQLQYEQDQCVPDERPLENVKFILRVSKSVR